MSEFRVRALFKGVVHVVVVIRLVYPLLCAWSSEKSVYDPSKLPSCTLKATCVVHVRDRAGLTECAMSNLDSECNGSSTSITMRVISYVAGSHHRVADPYCASISSYGTDHPELVKGERITLSLARGGRHQW